MVNIRNCREYIEGFLKIRTKEGKIIPFRLNPPQERLYAAIKSQAEAGKPVRIIILKARQMGFSTLTEGIGFWKCATGENVEGMVLAHEGEATNKIFAMTKRFYQHLPPPLRPMKQASNSKALIFDVPTRLQGKGLKGLGSKLTCATAGGNDPGRGSTLQFLHASEYAFWPGEKKDTLLGLLQAVPALPGTIVVIESTANGFEDFKDHWDAAVEAERAGIDGFLPVFFAWFEMPEYRREVPPGTVWTAEELAMRETFGLDDQQLAWRRWCIHNNCGDDLLRFRQEYPATPDEAFISTGACVFDKERIVLRRAQVREIKWEYGSFCVEGRPDGGSWRDAQFRWEPDPKGRIRVLEPPEEGVPYVIGADTAGTGGDWFAAHVIDNRTGKQVAVLHHQYGEREFCEQVCCLGRFYNDALLGVETNYSTFPGELLQEMDYPRLYVREKVDTYTGETVKAYGFVTSSKTRPAIIDGLKDVAREALENITDYETLGEMLTFVYDENWKPQAENGKHDDLVMSLAITHAIRGQQSSVKRRKWTKTMWEDYRRASGKQRQELMRQWGPSL